MVSEEELDPAERLAMARRYLGSADGDRYVTDNPDPERENVRVPDAPGALAQPGSGRRDMPQGSAARGWNTRGMSRWPRRSSERAPTRAPS